MNKLVVLGSVNADHVLQVSSFPRPGETVHGHSYCVIPGGKGANQAVAAARMGADIAFIACVGDDSFGHEMRAAFAKEGMNNDGVMIEKDMPTGIAMIQVAATGENSIVISAEANGSLSPERIKPHHNLIKQADTLLMQLEIPIATIDAAAKVAKAAGTRVVLNPAPAQPLPDDLLQHIDVITPNQSEAELLTGVKVIDMASAQQSADRLHDKGIKQVIVTMGSQGVWISENGKGRQVPGYRVDAKDTTAAGDTFNGALLTSLQEGRPMDEAIRFAHAAAAISVKRAGAQTSIPHRREVEDFLIGHQ